jgi:hypothetical protein
VAIVARCSTHAAPRNFALLVELEAAPKSSEGWASSIKENSNLGKQQFEFSFI